MSIKSSVLSLAVISSLTLSACGGSSDGDKGVVTPPAETNNAPTDILLSNSSVDENSIAAVIGNLTATDSNSGDTFTFSTTNTLFSISGNQLSLAADTQVDFEQEHTLSLDVTVTDSGAQTFTKTLNIDITDVLDTYVFNSKFDSEKSSVSYEGQIARHALISELNHYIGNQLKDDLDSILLTRQSVLDKLNLFYRTTAEQYPDLTINFMANTKQKFIAEISESHKNLTGKIAGNDGVDTDQHKSWATEFAGWGATGSTTPEGLIDILFGQLADNAEKHLNGEVRLSLTGTEINDIYLNEDGTDLQQLIQKFLLMSVAYSQATDDYFDDKRADGGLRVDNIERSKGTKDYSTLEHHFDEGFGYFGASREYLAYNDNELSGKVSTETDGRSDWNNHHDTDANGEFDLLSEVNFGNSTNAAKRDRGTVSNTSPTDYTKQVMEAFLAGRNIISDNVGSALTDEQFNALKAQRDIIVETWELAIATTVIHYINDTHADLSKLGSTDFNYADTAKHFSELKGFALGLQFNPFSKISTEKFEELHALIGNKPELESANIAAYQADLLAARDIIANALSLNAENVTNW